MHKIIEIAGLLAAATTAVAVFAGPAQAAPGTESTTRAHHTAADWPCDSWEFCVYAGRHGDGAHLSLNTGVWDLGGVGGGVLARNVHSARNISGKTWCLYSQVGYEGELTRVLDKFQGPVPDNIAGLVRSVGPC